MEPGTPVFDLPHATALAVAKADYLRPLLRRWAAELELKTAIDAGCGVGYFAGLLRESGFAVRGIDVRPENIAEARVRYPHVRFDVFDIENASSAALGEFDVVLCLGLLYHLENPFRAIRNLYALTRKVCVIETMIAPYGAPLAAFIEEREGEDQGREYAAQIPSRSWLLKVLSKSGFPFLYQPFGVPRHGDFRARFYRRRRRIVLVASKIGLPPADLRRLHEPRVTGRYMWYSFGLPKLLEQEAVRRGVKAAVRRWHSLRSLRRDARRSDTCG